VQDTPAPIFPPSLSARADRIRRYLTSAAIEAGKELIEARKECPPGLWVKWLEVEFGWSERTAYNLINVAEALATVANDVEIKELPTIPEALKEAIALLPDRPGGTPFMRAEAVH
jgi:hypothetical protein